MFYKILSVILGVPMIVGGINCAAMPLETYSVLPTLMGIALLADGIGRIVAWAAARRRNESRALLMISAILSLLLGIFLLSSSMLQLGVALVYTQFISGWITATGILRIIESFQIRRLRSEADGISEPTPEAEGFRAMLREVSGKWWIHLLLGILLVIAGVMSFINPLTTMIAVGTCMGIAIIIGGVDLIALAFVLG